MKALVIAGANIRLMPYLFGYFEQLSKLKYDITLFYWDRDGLEDRPLPKDVKPICFKKNMKNDIPKFLKIRNFIRYRKKALKVIKSQQYDRIIVCDTQFAVLLSDILIKKYKNKYIFDYRDPSYERFSFYKKRVATVVLNSKATFISSDAYRDCLPKYEHIYTVHNITMKDLKYREIRRENNREMQKIRISFWGCIRDTEVNLSFIKGIANDSRFEVHYYGTIEKTAEAILTYCKENSINNVYMHKEYLPDERYNFASTTDIIHNLYNNAEGSNPSLGNKFYDAIIFYLPQICTKGGFMGDEAVKYGVGITVDPSIPFADKLFNYYQNINWIEFEENCDNCLKIILEDYKESNKAVSNALNTQYHH